MFGMIMNLDAPTVEPTSTALEFKAAGHTIFGGTFSKDSYLSIYEDGVVRVGIRPEIYVAQSNVNSFDAAVSLRVRAEWLGEPIGNFASALPNMNFVSISEKRASWQVGQHWRCPEKDACHLLRDVLNSEFVAKARTLVTDKLIRSHMTETDEVIDNFIEKTLVEMFRKNNISSAEAGEWKETKPLFDQLADVQAKGHKANLKLV